MTLHPAETQPPADETFEEALERALAMLPTEDDLDCEDPESVLARLPTEDDLPYDDGEPMDSGINWINMTLLRVTLMRAWEGRDFYVGGDQFVYFSPERARDRDFRGPDVFVVLDVPPHMRKSWVVWAEGKGPDVVIELLSRRTARVDRGDKLRIYQDELRVPEYYWYNIDTGELVGWRLNSKEYQPIEPDEQGRLYSRKLDLYLVRHESSFHGGTLPWLRWAYPDGTILPTDEEAAAEAQHQAEEEHQRAEAERRRADEAEARLAELQARLARYEREDGRDA